MNLAFDLQPRSGATGWDCLKQARILAIFLNEPVSFVFNDTTITVDPLETPMAAWRRYCEARDKNPAKAPEAQHVP